MNPENLIPVTKVSPEEALRRQRKGGRSKSQRKSDGQKLRFIKARVAKGISNKADRDWMMEKITNRDACASDIFLYIDEIRDTIHPAQRIALGNLMTQAAKFHHGDKSHVTSTNLNISIDLESYLDALYEKRKGDLE